LVREAAMAKQAEFFEIVEIAPPVRIGPYGWGSLS
jgi:hypothetical protein